MYKVVIPVNATTLRQSINAVVHHDRQVAPWFAENGIEYKCDYAVEDTMPPHLPDSAELLQSIVYIFENLSDATLFRLRF
jgi:hypothetical protein